MNTWPIQNLRSKLFSVAGLSAGLAILMVLSTSAGPLEIQLASANSHLGILGRLAPELNLDNWIDAEGNQTAPIQISNHRGKVIYLYFFQDW